MNTETVPAQIPAENVIQFTVMDLTGDTKTVWDKTKPVEVEAAREMFKKLRASGYLAYKVAGEKGDKGEAFVEFDPNAGAIIFSPALQGG